jgi:hypothetical protein
MLKKLIFTVVALFAAVPVFAVTIGELQPGGGTVASRGGELAPLTIINFSRPAIQSGTVDRATVMWTGAPAGGCTNAFKIKIFRSTSQNGVQVLAERGPFNVIQGINNVQLNPSISIQAGDLIGITQLQPLACGGVVNRRTDRHEAWGSVPVDPAAGATVDDFAFTHGLVPSVRATSEASPVHGYLPVVGSTAGGFGSLFKTSVQLTNRGSSEITGRLIFHPAGTSGVPTHPQVTYTLQPQQTQSIEDVVAATGVSGVGSMDLVTTSGYPPDVTARIYNDEGPNGTSGFTEELMTAHQALHRFDRGSLTIPTDLTNFRMNIGIRTLDAGAEINIIQYDANGVLTGTFVERNYPANYFEQISASQFISGAAIAPGGFLVVQVETGSAFIYAAITDNRTNDGLIRFPTKY